MSLLSVNVWFLCVFLDPYTQGHVKISYMKRVHAWKDLSSPSPFYKQLWRRNEVRRLETEIAILFPSPSAHWRKGWWRPLYTKWHSCCSQSSGGSHESRTEIQHRACQSPSLFPQGLKNRNEQIQLLLSSVVFTYRPRVTLPYQSRWVPSPMITWGGMSRLLRYLLFICSDIISNSCVVLSFCYDSEIVQMLSGVQMMESRSPLW